MRKIFAALMLSLALIAGPAMAQDSATEANHAAAVEAAKVTAAPAVEKNELVTIADGLADAVTRTASKLNVEIQDFITSPAGFVLMAGVRIKYAGHEINQWIGALVWLTVFGGLWLWWARKTLGIYNEKGKFVSFKWYSGETGDVPGGAILAFISALIIMIVFAIQLP